MTRFVAFTVNGLSTGMIYAAVALSLVLIWRATRVVNFAVGAMAMVTTFVALAVYTRTGSYWLGFTVALLAGFALGAGVERLVVRRLAGAPPLAAVLVTLGLLIVLEAGAGIVFGGEFRSFPAAFSQRALRVGGTATLSPFALFAVGAVLAVMAALLALFRGTRVGLQLRAAAFAPEVARLLGVRVGRMLTLGWALASLVGSLAGLLIAPTTLLHPTSMDGVLVHGFAAAVLGGLDSPTGAVAGGLIVGLALSYVGGYLGGELISLAALAILVGVLMLRPAGLFATTTVRRV